jgi:hypothetical protein
MLFLNVAYKSGVAPVVRVVSVVCIKVVHDDAVVHIYMLRGGQGGGEGGGDGGRGG